MSSCFRGFPLAGSRLVARNEKWNDPSIACGPGGLFPFLIPWEASQTNQHTHTISRGVQKTASQFCLVCNLKVSQEGRVGFATDCTPWGGLISQVGTHVVSRQEVLRGRVDHFPMSFVTVLGLGTTRSGSTFPC